MANYKEYLSPGPKPMGISAPYGPMAPMDSLGDRTLLADEDKAMMLNVPSKRPDKEEYMRSMVSKEEQEGMDVLSESDLFSKEAAFDIVAMRRKLAEQYQDNQIRLNKERAANYLAQVEARVAAERQAAAKTTPGRYLPTDRVAPLIEADGGYIRSPKQEGSLMVPPEMEQEMPVDTYPNIPPEEMAEAEASQLPDVEMEDKYIDFVMDESLDEEEQSYLMNTLEADPKLSQIFDKVMTTASEFTGSGEVEGPGTGVSDSIPARLSDGEFVFTKKATDQVGADNLQTMMDEAELAFDGGLQTTRESAQEGGLLLYKQKDEDPLAYEKIAQDEIKKSMLRSNRAPSLNPGSI